MGMSDKIEAFILELMKQEEEANLKIQRNELAEIFGCVPSQINYVISTRFSPERGYIVSSRRGGGGCVTIRRMGNNTEIGNEISERDAYSLIKRLYDTAKITHREALIMQTAVSDASLYNVSDKNRARADILRNMLEVQKEVEL